MFMPCCFRWAVFLCRKITAGGKTRHAEYAHHKATAELRQAISTSRQTLFPKTDVCRPLSLLSNLHTLSVLLSYTFFIWKFKSKIIIWNRSEITLQLALFLGNKYKRWIVSVMLLHTEKNGESKAAYSSTKFKNYFTESLDNLEDWIYTHTHTYTQSQKII